MKCGNNFEMHDKPLLLLSIFRVKFVIRQYQRRQMYNDAKVYVNYISYSAPSFGVGKYFCLILIAAENNDTHSDQKLQNETNRKRTLNYSGHDNFFYQNIQGKCYNNFKWQNNFLRIALFLTLYMLAVEI